MLARGRATTRLPRGLLRRSGHARGSGASRLPSWPAASARRSAIDPRPTSWMFSLTQPDRGLVDVTAPRARRRHEGIRAHARRSSTARDPRAPRHPRHLANPHADRCRRLRARRSYSSARWPKPSPCGSPTARRCCGRSFPAVVAPPACAPSSTPGRGARARIRSAVSSPASSPPGFPSRSPTTASAPWEVDLYWPAHGLVVEVDGYAAHSSPTAFERDRRKDADLTRRGLDGPAFQARTRSATAWSQAVGWVAARLITPTANGSPQSGQDSRRFQERRSRSQLWQW